MPLNMVIQIIVTHCINCKREFLHEKITKKANACIAQQQKRVVK